MTNVPEDRVVEEIREAIKIDGDAVRGHLDELVRSTVEETLNKLLDAEADELCGEAQELCLQGLRTEPNVGPDPLLRLYRPAVLSRFHLDSNAAGRS